MINDIPYLYVCLTLLLSAVLFHMEGYARYCKLTVFAVQAILFFLAIRLKL
jgi:hypothetical protein